jgi:hypothetical protein
VKALKYDRYDINRYHFWMVKLEVSHLFAATTNSGEGPREATGWGGERELNQIILQEVAMS